MPLIMLGWVVQVRPQPPFNSATCVTGPVPVFCVQGETYVAGDREVGSDEAVRGRCDGWLLFPASFRIVLTRRQGILHT